MISKYVLVVAANIAVLAVCLIIGGSIVEKRFFAQRHREPVYGLQTGQALPPIKGINYGAKKRTVLVFANTKCGACVRSVPDIKQIAVTVEHTTNAQAFGIFAEPQSHLATIREAGFVLPAVPVESFVPYRVAATPTTVLLDEHGRVQNLWVGVLERATLERLLKDLA